MGAFRREREKIKQLRRNIDNHKCQICGRSSPSDNSSRAMPVHHILPKEAGGIARLGNLVTLCDYCHSEVEEADCQYCLRRYAEEAENLKIASRVADRVLKDVEKSGDERSAKSGIAEVVWFRKPINTYS